MDFGWALTQMRAGGKVCREGWLSTGLWLGLQQPEASGVLTSPYIYTRTVDGHFVPWSLGQPDVLATDWVIAPVDLPTTPPRTPIVRWVPEDRSSAGMYPTPSYLPGVSGLVSDAESALQFTSVDECRVWCGRNQGPRFFEPREVTVFL